MTTVSVTTLLLFLLSMFAACAAPVGVSIEKATIARDDSIYECFPSLTRLSSGKLVLVYRESDGHGIHDFCRLIVRTSNDNGKSFSKKFVLLEEKWDGKVVNYYNCPKVQQLKDGRVLIVCDVFKNPPGETSDHGRASKISLWYSSDEAKTWGPETKTSIPGIMPDEVIELDSGDWLLATQVQNPLTNFWVQCVSRSTDGGKTWAEPTVIAAKDGFHFCEASILKLPNKTLVCYIRENSYRGWPIYKSISTDDGKTWKGPYETQMHGGHRPVAHLTKSGKVLITYRHAIGGYSPNCKNLFAFLETAASALEPVAQQQSGILLCLDHDRNAAPDGGYTGWVETAPGEFFAVNYIKDDAPKAQIRSYRFKESDF